MQVPMSDGSASSFANYEEKVTSWGQISSLGPRKRAANLLLNMSDVARKVCMSVGKDDVGNAGGVAQILKILRERFAPDAINSVFLDVVKFLYFKRTQQNMDTYLSEFDMLQEKAEARLPMGSGPPDEFASVLYIQNAALSKNEKTLVPASLQNTLAFQAVSAQMRRLFGPRGYASRQDVLAAADMNTASKEEDFETWMAYRKPKRAEKDGKSGRGNGAKEKRKPSEEERAKNSFNRRTGEQNRRYTCNNGYHYAPQRPQQGNRHGGAPSPLRRVIRSSNKPYCSIAMEAPLSVGSSRKPAPGGPDRSREQCFSTTLDIGGQFAASNSDSVAVLGAGATANLVRFKWLDNRIIFLQRQDFPKVMPYSTSARFKFGGGRATEVKHAADIKVGIAWGEGAFAGFVLDSDIPALLRRGVLGSLGAQLDFERDILSIRTHGVNVPLNVNEMGRYVLSTVEFGKGPPYWARVPVWAASYSEWPISEKRPDLSVGGLRLPLGESGLLRFVPPKEFST